jgi:hypothetical protein
MVYEFFGRRDDVVLDEDHVRPELTNCGGSVATQRHMRSHCTTPVRWAGCRYCPSAQFPIGSGDDVYFVAGPLQFDCPGL